MENDGLSVPRWVLDQFEAHTDALRKASAARRESVSFRNVVEDRAEREASSVADQLGKRQPGDVYEGDVNLRTLRLLLKMIDERGWERSEHQMRFHSAFERCVARVLYRTEWATQRPAIMKHQNWEKCSSEVMISTPRRFGKTFRRVTIPFLCALGADENSHVHSIAIFCACLALSMGCEVVIFRLVPAPILCLLASLSNSATALCAQSGSSRIAKAS